MRQPLQGSWRRPPGPALPPRRPRRLPRVHAAQQRRATLPETGPRGDATRPAVGNALRIPTRRVPTTTGDDDDRPQGRQTQQDRAWTQAQRRTDNLPPENHTTNDDYYSYDTRSRDHSRAGHRRQLHPPADWHDDPGAAPRRDRAAIEVCVLPTDRTPGADGAPYPITIAENRAGQANIDVGSLILLERDREAARQEEADPVRFARVDFVGTLRNGRRLVHVRWFRSTTSTGGFAFFRHALAPDPLRNQAGHPGARRHPPRHLAPTGATLVKPQRLGSANGPTGSSAESSATPRET